MLKQQNYIKIEPICGDDFLTRSNFMNTLVGRILRPNDTSPLYNHHPPTWMWAEPVNMMSYDSCDYVRLYGKGIFTNVIKVTYQLSLG